MNITLHGAPTVAGQLTVNNGPDGYQVEIRLDAGSFPSEMSATIRLDWRQAQALAGMLESAVETAQATLKEMREEVESEMPTTIQ